MIIETLIILKQLLGGIFFPNSKINFTLSKGIQMWNLIVEDIQA